MDGPDRARRLIAMGLARAERRLVAVLGMLDEDLRLTRTLDPVDDVAAVLGPVLDAVRSAAQELELAPGTRSQRSKAEATATLIWSDMCELEPERLRRAYGLEDFPPAWTRLQAELAAGALHAAAELDR